MIFEKSNSKKNITLVVGVIVVLLCFAGNSLIARAALLQGHIAPIPFTSIRLLAGAATLLPFFLIRRKKQKVSYKKALLSSLALMLYAFLFSLAYVSLNAGLGALILFTSVQVSMFGISLLRGKQFKKRDYLGVSIALSGLSLIFIPGELKIDFFYSSLMLLSGVAWGVYSLIGGTSKDPIIDGALSFLLSTPVAFVFLFFNFTNITSTGLLLAILSGSITSGLAYSLWYYVSTKMEVSVAAIVQTTVPVIAATFGIIFLNEAISLNFIAAMMLVILGIFIKSRSLKTST